MNSGTVQKPLTTGETLEFAAAVMQQLGRSIDPDKARYYICNKSALGKDIRKLGIHQMPEFDLREWEAFYGKHFGGLPEFSSFHVPVKPEYPCRAILVVGQTNNTVFDACTKAFNGKTWRYERDLDTIKDVVTRPADAYVVWVRDTVEADADMANKSANDVEAASINTLTLKERMLLELKYHDETGKHLDVENVTLCTGSRNSDGGVPGVLWDGEFRVNWCYPGDRFSDLRARVAVS